MGDQFSPEQKAELISMYTGMAMQGLTASAPVDGFYPDSIANQAVIVAVATVEALDKYHSDRAAAERAERHAKIASSNFKLVPSDGPVEH